MRTVTAIFTLVISCTIIFGCAGAGRKEAPARHPEELTRQDTDCLECHDDDLTGTLKPYGTFRHTNSFLQRHGSYAMQGQDLCNSCHGEPLCLECHATKDELSPALKHGDRPDRDLPHRGDYIVQHQIDGRLDPGSCVKCHGNRNDEGCVVCHQ
jgi:hypothetical protein